MSITVPDILKELINNGFEEAKTQKQQAVLEAALKLFAEKGYANTSTAEIAKVAGVSVGTVFKQYKTKEQILISAILPMIHEFAPKISQLTEEEKIEQLNKIPNFEVFVTLLFKERVEFVNKNKDILTVIIKEAIYNDDLKALLAPIVISSVPRVLSLPIEHFKKNNDIKDIPTELIISSLTTILLGFFLRYLLYGFGNLDTDSEIDSLVSQFVNGIKK